VTTMRFGDDEVGGEYRDVSVRNKDKGSVCMCCWKISFF
jgi:hypothetical protein